AYRARLKLVPPRVTDQGSPSPPLSLKVAAPAEPTPISGVVGCGGRGATHEPCDHGGDRRHVGRDPVAGDARAVRGAASAAGPTVVRPSLDPAVTAREPGAGLARAAPRCAVCGVPSAFVRLAAQRRSRPRPFHAVLPGRAARAARWRR